MYYIAQLLAALIGVGMVLVPFLIFDMLERRQQRRFDVPRISLRK